MFINITPPGKIISAAAGVMSLTNYFMSIYSIELNKALNEYSIMPGFSPTWRVHEVLG